MRRRETQRTESALGKEIAEKRRLLYERHGGRWDIIQSHPAGTDGPKNTMFQPSALEQESEAMKQILWLRQSYRAVGWYKDAPDRGGTRERAKTDDQ